MRERECATPLCVLLPEVGLASETFLRWDATRLLPGGTAVIADPPPHGRSLTGTPRWSVASRLSLVFDPIPGDPRPPRQRVQAAIDFLRRHQVRVALIEYLDFADRWFDHLRRAGVPVWLRGHGVDLSARLREPMWVNRYRRYTAAEGIVVPSRAAADALRGVGLPARKLHPLPHPVAVPRYRPRDPHGQVRCVAVGRLVPKKAPLLMLAAFREAQRVEPRLVLDVVGDGPLAGEVTEFLDAHRLRGSVRLHGELPHRHTLRLVRHGDILLHHAVTSPIDGDREGQPLAVLEAMAAGLAVVATNHAGIPEIIADGVTGRLVPEGAVHDMARVTVDLAADSLARRRLGHAARAFVRARHTTRRSRAQLLQLLGLHEPEQDQERQR